MHLRGLVQQGGCQNYGPEIVAFDGSEKPLFAMKQGNCIGYVYDQTFLQGKLLEDEWKADYDLPLKGILPSPWGIAVALEKASLQKCSKIRPRTG